MSIETSLVLNVGDGVDAAKAKATLTCVFAQIVAGMTLTLNIPEEDPIVFTQGEEFTGGTDDDTFAEEIRALLDAVADLTATRAGAVVTVERDVAGAEGNDWALVSSAPAAITATAFADGRDADDPVPLELKVDKDGLMTAKVDGELVFRVPFTQVFDTNTKTMQVELTNFLRKFQV